MNKSRDLLTTTTLFKRFVKWDVFSGLSCLRILVFKVHHHCRSLSILQFTYGGRCGGGTTRQNLLSKNKIHQAAFTRGRFTCKNTKTTSLPVRYPVNWMAFYATQNGTILLEAFARTAASRPYRIYSIKRCPRSNAADGSKITNKRRPRMNRAPNENEKNLGTTCACVQTSPFSRYFLREGGRGSVCTQAIQLGNLHHPDIYDNYLSEIRETLEPLNYIIFTNDLPPLIKRHS